MEDFQLITTCESSQHFKETCSIDVLVFGCACVSPCNDDEECVCLAQHDCAYSEEKLLKNFNWDEPIYECNSCCSCPKSCANRQVQYGCKWELKVVLTEKTGFGLVTVSFIPKGSFVIEYIGEIITHIEAVELSNRNENSYLYTLKEHFGDQVKRYYLNAFKKGNMSRFINHSCDANLSMTPVRIDSTYPHFSLFAVIDIQPHTELTFCYGTDVKRNNSDVGNTKVCHCYSKNCKGFLPFDSSLFL